MRLRYGSPSRRRTFFRDELDVWLDVDVVWNKKERNKWLERTDPDKSTKELIFSLKSWYALSEISPTSEKSEVWIRNNLAFLNNLTLGE